MKYIITLSICLFLAVINAGAVRGQALNGQDVKVLYDGLDNPTALYLTHQNIFVVEQGKNRILKLDYSGEVLGTYGSRGSSDYQLNRPVDIDATNGLKVFISDLGNNRIQVFDRHWQLLSSIKDLSAFRSNRRINPTFLSVNKQGELLFYDNQAKSILKMNENGAFIDEFPVPAEVKDVAKLQLMENSILLLDKKQKAVHKISENGLYESFYPTASGTTSFHKTKNALWTADAASVNKDGEEFWQLNRQKETIRDIFVTENRIFVLTNKTLLSIDI